MLFRKPDIIDELLEVMVHLQHCKEPTIDSLFWKYVSSNQNNIWACYA